MQKLFKIPDLETKIMRMLASGYYFITSSKDNPATDRPVLETVFEALKGGAGIVQYREKVLPYNDRLLIAKGIKSLKSLYNFTFIINDDPVLARAVDADGVHIGQKDLKKFSYHQARALLGHDKIIGLSTSTMEQAEKAVSDGADYVSIGPIYKTSTKLDGDDPCGLDLVEKVRKRMEAEPGSPAKLKRIPIVAIGGINLSNYMDVIRAGADTVCMIQPVLQHDNISGIIDSIRNRINHTNERMGRY